MERKRIFRSGVVLLELMAAILIFALAGAVCVQVLLKADALATQAENLDNGVNYVSSTAEIFRGAANEEEAWEILSQVWPQTKPEQDGIAQIPFENGELEIIQGEADGMGRYTIRWIAEDQTVFELEILRSYEEVVE